MVNNFRADPVIHTDTDDSKLFRNFKKEPKTIKSSFFDSFFVS